jgi:hypothetical protein
MLTTIPLYGNGTPHPIFVLRDFSELPNGYDLGWAMCGVGSVYKDEYKKFLLIKREIRTLTSTTTFVKYNARFSEYSAEILSLIESMQGIMASSIIYWLTTMPCYFSLLDYDESRYLSIDTSLSIPCIPHPILDGYIQIEDKIYRTSLFQKNKRADGFMPIGFYDAYIQIYKKYCYILYLCSLMMDDRFTRYNNRLVYLFQSLIGHVENMQNISVTVVLMEALSLNAKLIYDSERTQHKLTIATARECHRHECA